MPLHPTFAVLEFDSGHVIEATWPNSQTEVLVGLFTTRRAAQSWLDDVGGRQAMG